MEQSRIKADSASKDEDHRPANTPVNSTRYSGSIVSEELKTSPPDAIKYLVLE